MQEEKHQPKKILEQFRSGELSKTTRRKVFNWLASLDVSTVKEREALITRSQLRSWMELEPAIAETPVRQQFKIPLWLKYAAAAVLLLISYGIWNHQRYRQNADAGMVWLETSTKAAEIKRITLSDGSVVTLASKSTLKYPRSFSKAQREVHLSGQGFFDIMHDTLRPFAVRARTVKVQVLGTAFEVRAYTDDPDLRVVVASGKVGVMAEVAGKQKTFFLQRSQGLEYFPGDQRIQLNRFDDAALPDWQQHRLMYRNESLEAITRSLGRHFDMQFVIKNEHLKAKRLSLDSKLVQLDTVMKALAISGGFKYSITKKTVTIW